MRNPNSLVIIAAAATLGIAAISWTIALKQMSGMQMGIATSLGSFPAFLALWIPMMAAMMLPSAAPAVMRCARHGGRARDVALFIAAYLAVWTLVGVAVYVAYRPHDSLAAGAAAIVAGLYEFTPFKRYCRRRCREDTGSGSMFGLSCLGSSIGLMLLPLAFGIMSVPWMVAVTALVLAQKLAPARIAFDAPVAVALVGLGLVVLIAPAIVPGVLPSM